MSRNRMLDDRLAEWRAAEAAEARTDPASPERRTAVARTRRARHAYELEAIRQAEAGQGPPSGGLDASPGRRLKRSRDS
jgi:hypothetical protein